MKKVLFILFIYAVCAKSLTHDGNETHENNPVVINQRRYKPDWNDLDTRPLPEWYDKAKIGIFIHWGVFSVPSFESEWFWYYWLSDHNANIKHFMAKNYPPDFTYQNFAPMFTAEFFDPDDWAKLFAKAGARYIVLTTKHHEGFTLFPSRRSFGWNSMDVGPKRDIVEDLSKAVREHDMKFGAYHSLFEWYNPIFEDDSKQHFKTHLYPRTKLLPDITQLINDYEPSVLWSDGDWSASDRYWNSTGLLSWLYNDSPVKNEIVVNDRWGKNTACRHGDFYNCKDRYNPGKLQKHKWENAFTIDKKSWGYRRNMEFSQILSINDILKEIVTTVSCGGNALINVGPTKEGTIPPVFQERLITLGAWLNVTGEAIYDTSPWFHQNDTVNGNVWYTCKKEQYNATHPTAVPSDHDTVTAIYAIFLVWPTDSLLGVKNLAPYLRKGIYQVELLGNKNVNLAWKITNGVAVIALPDKASVTSGHAWALKITEK